MDISADPLGGEEALIISNRYKAPPWRVGSLSMPAQVLLDY